MPIDTAVFLEGLGLTGYSARAYITLAECTPSTAVALAGSARIPRQRIYDVLEDLMKRGIVTRTEGRPAAYHAMDPTRAVRRLLEVRRQELLNQERAAAPLVEYLHRTWLHSGQQHLKGDPSGRVSLTKADRWCDLVLHSVSATVPRPPASSTHSAWLAGVERLTHSGVTIRCVYDREVLNDPYWLTHVRRFSAAGEQARITNITPTEMILSDASHAMLPLPVPGEANRGNLMLLIEDNGIVNCLVEAFERLWTTATPLSEFG